MKLLIKNNSNTISNINFPEISQLYNPVTFKQNIKAKYIKIAISEDLNIQVNYPFNVEINKAIHFFKSKIIWVNNSLIKMSKKQQIRIKNQEKYKNNLTKQEFLIKNQYLVKRCRELAQKYNFSIGKISLRFQKTIWGSCSSQNNISLNSNLSFLSNNMIDYVILHELTHTKIKNHSQKFWKELAKVLPEAIELDKELKKYSPNFFKK